MNQIDLQIVSTSQLLPTIAHFQMWVDIVLKTTESDHEILIRLVDEQESARLNERYRHKQGSTNILSFPFDAPDMIESTLLGDLIICVPVIEAEAIVQHKPLLHHWAHIVIHGLLHLCGYDHIEQSAAEEMEAKEIRFLKTLLIDNPYEEKKIHEQ
ncbi:MAG: rRNA maturation RNase YbeY [Methylococcales bacterium]|nr:rRNA maturation RNase YbeY [Methylococcales bacterium]